MNDLLDCNLRRLAAYYSLPGVEEVAINQPGEIWVKEMGASWAVKAAPSLSEDYLLSLCRQLANVNGQSFHPQRMPLLYVTLPQGHRFTAVTGATVRYAQGDSRGIAITVRVFNPDRRIALDRYGLDADGTLACGPIRQGRQRYGGSPLEDLSIAVQRQEAILISGATSTGKTTFLNAIVGMLPSDVRVLTVEDARELIVPQPNRVHLVVSRTESSCGIDFLRVVDAVVRMTPDVILCGEISIANATGVFRLMTTGHTNFMATIHASTPEGALRAFYQNLAQTNPGIDAAAATEIIANAFGRIVQIDRHGPRRVVTAIEIPSLAMAALRPPPPSP
ncbi:MAG TPA: Flp pilus assembly complex ATPase component TadA [Rhodospirillaceae bacterium]|nr:Flp pilus assembly complex ATPase component TadA [Rhodospirillaceae bacterium]